MKQKILCIHGALPIHLAEKYLQKIILTIYKNFFNFIPQYKDRIIEWENLFIKEGYDVQRIYWQGKIVPYTVADAIKNLERKIDEQPKNTIIFTDSIGAHIALEACKIHKNNKIRKIIAVCPVAKKHPNLEIEFINCYSTADKFAIFSESILWPFQKKQNYTKYVTHIDMTPLRHDQFQPEKKIRNKQLKKIVLDQLK